MAERESQPLKKVVIWSAEAKAELRAIDREKDAMGKLRRGNYLTP
jgi:hypothetical protein